jgi:hypothetical protein
MYSRSFKVEDYPAVVELFKKAYPGTPFYMDCEHNIIVATVIVNEDDKVIGVGAVTLIADYGVVIDPELTGRQKAAIMHQLTTDAIVATKKAGLPQINVFSHLDRILNIYKRHYGFYDNVKVVSRNIS